MQQHSDDLLDRLKRGLVRTVDDQDRVIWVDPLVKMAELGVPEHLCGGLKRYLVNRIRPGHFLTTVLENNLREAVSRGDENSLAGLKPLIIYLYNHAPSEAWGHRNVSQPG